MNKVDDYERTALSMRKVDIANEIYMLKTMIKALKIRIDNHWKDIKELEKEYDKLKNFLENGSIGR